jgi:hypothetical protein
MTGVEYRVTVVAMICEENIRMATPPASLAENAWENGDCLHGLPVVDGIRWRGVGEGVRSAYVHDERVLCPRIPAVSRTWAIGIAAECTNQEAVEDRQPGLGSAGVLEKCDKVDVKLVPESKLFPSSKSALGGAARTAEFEWRVPERHLTTSTYQRLLNTARC